MTDSQFPWDEYIIDLRDERIYRKIDRSLVTIAGQSKPLNPLTVRLLIQLMMKEGEAVYAGEIEDWKTYNLQQRGKRFTDHMSTLKRSLRDGLFDENIREQRRRNKSDDEVGYEFFGKLSSPIPVDYASGDNMKPRAQPEWSEEKIRAIAEELGLDTEAFLQKVLALKSQPDRKQQLDEITAANRLIREKNIHTKLLNDYYKDSALAKEGLARYVVQVGDNGPITTNIVIGPAGLDFTQDLELHRSPAQFTYVGEHPAIPLLPEDGLARYLADAWLNNMQAENEPVFCLHDFVSSNPKAPMSFSLARYFDFRLEAGRLGAELNCALRKTRFSVDEVINGRETELEYREELLPDPAAILNCKTRICVGGVNVVFAVRRINLDEGLDDFVFWVGERSSAVAYAQGEYSIIPSGFHAVLIEERASKMPSPWQSVYRELGEELFRRDEAISRNGKSDFDPRGLDCPALFWFKGRENKVLHEMVSFGFDLIDGSYQFGILLVVQDPYYWEEHGFKARGNYEYKYKGRRRALTVSTKNKNEIARILNEPLCSHTSIAAIIPALKRLKEIDPARVDLPDIKVLKKWR